MTAEKDREEVIFMNTHHGGKVGAAAKKLATPSTSRKAKTAAAKTLVAHRNKVHR